MYSLRRIALRAKAGLRFGSTLGKSASVPKNETERLIGLEYRYGAHNYEVSTSTVDI